MHAFLHATTARSTRPACRGQTRFARRTPAPCCDTHASDGHWQRTNGTTHYNTAMRTGPQAKSGAHVGAGSLHASKPAPHLAGHVPTWLERSARAVSTSALTSLNGSAPDMRAALKTSAVAACPRCPRFRAHREPSKSTSLDDPTGTMHKKKTHENVKT